MLGSLAVFVEEGHHVDAGPHHEDHKEEISNHHDIQKCHCIVVLQLVGLTVYRIIPKTSNCEIVPCPYSFNDVDIDVHLPLFPFLLGHQLAHLYPHH